MCIAQRAERRMEMIVYITWVSGFRCQIKEERSPKMDR